MRTGDITTESRYIKRIEGVFEELMKYAKIDVSRIKDRGDLQKFLESAKAKGVESGGLARWIQKTDKYSDIVEQNRIRESMQTESGKSASGVSPSTRNKKEAKKNKIVYLHSKGKKYAYDYGRRKRVSYKLYSQIEKKKKAKE